MHVRLLGLASLLLTLESLPVVLAWWDQGHLLAATIARRSLSDPTSFEKLLKSDWSEFANLSDLVNASVWADYIKTKEQRVCETALSSCAAASVFNGWHHVIVPYNPLNASEAELSTILKVEPLGMNRDAYFHGWADAVTAVLEADRSLRSTSRHSSFSWQLHLRMVLHVLVDLHQPLHVTSLFTKRFPAGDRSGHSIKLNMTGLPDSLALYLKKDMHNLWDGCGDLYTWRWPIAQELLDIEADQLIAEHGQDAFVEEGRLKAWADYQGAVQTEFVQTFTESIVQDTFSLVEKVYEEFLNSADVEAALADARLELPTFQPSLEYVNFVKTACRTQLTLAGYRLGQWLQSVEPYLPKVPVQEEEKEKPHNCPAPPVAMPTAHMAASFVVGALLSACATAIVQRYFISKRQDSLVPLVDDQRGMEFRQW